jgi:hypothetical protein
MKTHNLKSMPSVDLYLAQLNEEQLTGDKLSTHLQNIVMAFWHELTSPFLGNPDQYDIHQHGIDGPYRCLKMTPGADVIDTVFDRVDDRAADLTKALNKAFNTASFSLKVQREGGELDLMVAFTGAEGGIFTCNSTENGGSFAVALRIPNEEELKVTFDSMAQVPTPSNVMGGEDELEAGPELEVEPELDLDDIPETEPELDIEPELEEEEYDLSEDMDDMKPKKQIKRPEFDTEPFDPTDEDTDSADLDDTLGHPIDEDADMDRAEKLGQIEGALKALVLKIEDPRIVAEIERLIKIAEAKPVDLDFKGFSEATNLVLRMMAPKSMEEGFGKLKDAPKTADRWEKEMTVKLSKDGETKTFVKGASGIEKHKADGWEEVQEEEVAGMSVANMGGAVPGHDAGPGPVKKRKKLPEQTEYRYVSLTKLNPFER